MSKRTFNQPIDQPAIVLMSRLHSWIWFVAFPRGRGLWANGRQRQLESLAKMSKCLVIKPFVVGNVISKKYNLGLLSINRIFFFRDNLLVPLSQWTLFVAFVKKVYGEKAAFKSHTRMWKGKETQWPECSLKSHSTQHLNRHMVTHQKGKQVIKLLIFSFLVF